MSGIPAAKGQKNFNVKHVQTGEETSACQQEDRHSLEEIRRRIEHEANLLKQRVSWIVSSQAFLLTGYAILLNAPIELRTEHYVRDQALFVKLIPITSICIRRSFGSRSSPVLRRCGALRATAKKHPGYEG